MPGLVLACVMLLPAFESLGQAGSSAPMIFHGPEITAVSGSVTQQVEPMLPTSVIGLADTEQYLLWVDVRQGKLHVLELDGNGGMGLRQVIPVSIGKKGYGKQREGDKKTPVGVYRLTSFLKDAVLDDFYGLGAFPLNYPNVVDRQQGRTGSGIWLHGLPKDVNTRPLLDSDGCVVIDNSSLEAMHEFINTGVTHMVISDQPLAWRPARQAKQVKTGIESALAGWLQAWEDRDNDKYLSFYADDFTDFRRNKDQWSEYKSRVNNGKSWIEIDISAASYYADLKQPELVTVRYYQDYNSSNYQWRGWKEQLWRKSGNGWEIVYEGNG